MKQTAVEWLISNLQQSKDWQRVLNEVSQMSTVKFDLLDQAKAMENEQRFEDFKQGFHSAFESLEAANNSVQSKTFKSE